MCSCIIVSIINLMGWKELHNVIHNSINHNVLSNQMRIIIIVHISSFVVYRLQDKNDKKNSITAVRIATWLLHIMLVWQLINTAFYTMQSYLWSVVVEKVWAFGLMRGGWECCGDDVLLRLDLWTGLRLGGRWLGRGGASGEGDFSLAFPGSSNGSSR